MKPADCDSRYPAAHWANSQFRRTQRARGPKILFIGEAVSMAHVGRPAMLARWAREAGYEISFYSGSEYAHVARTEGLIARDLPTISSKSFYRRLRSGKFFYTRADLDDYVEAERSIIRSERPDLIVGDFRLTLAVSASLERVPMMALQQAHWSPASKTILPPPEAGVFGLLPQSLRNALFNFLRPLALRLFASQLDALRSRHGLPRRLDFRKNYTDGTYCAYLDLPALTQIEPLPPGHFFLGPLFWTPRRSESIGARHSNFNGRRIDRSHTPSAYVSMGSSGEVRILPKVFGALAKAGFENIWSSTRGSDKVSFPGVHYVGTTDPSDYLEHASLTVCHGGSGTVYQSFASGVPVLCLTSNPDQQLIGKAIMQSGSGTWLPAAYASADRIRRAAIQVASDPCRKAAEALAAKIREHDTRARWLEWLEETLPFELKGEDPLSLQRYAARKVFAAQ